MVCVLGLWGYLRLHWAGAPALFQTQQVCKVLYMYIYMAIYISKIIPSKFVRSMIVN